MKWMWGKSSLLLILFYFNFERAVRGPSRSVEGTSCQSLGAGSSEGGGLHGVSARPETTATGAESRGERGMWMPLRKRPTRAPGHP